MSTIDKIAAKIDTLKLPSFGILKLKDLIKAVRNAKTQADERAVIAKESAAIRTSFKEENPEQRSINVAKLLYIHMLGYPAHFGQMECVKLVASPRFADKRLGYLGIMLLLDENQEVLTLVTNSLQNDMKHANMFIVGLALATLGNISSPAMARDLADDVVKLLSSSNSYIRKKAGLCALRIIRKVPDLTETFLDRARALLVEKNHGVLLTGITLLTEMCNASSEVKSSLKLELVPALVRHLKNLVSAGFSPEHDVSGICDPFLQVKILRLMRLLGKNDKEASEAMNDVLAQVATNTESSKNVGHAILYETVLTIMDIESESSLRVLAINILGKFLANRDNNIRYVALTTLCKTCSQSATSNSDNSALQRHRATVLDCLRDADVSIRRRALDLSFYLINTQNIRLLTRELLSYLEVAESEVKASVADRICDAASKYRPNKRWEVDTVVRVLKAAGSYVTQEVVNHFVKLISTAPSELQQYTVRKLFNIVKHESDKALNQEGLVLAMTWCIGEFGDILVRGNGGTGGLFDEGDDDKPEGDLQVAPNETEVLALIDNLLRGPYATPTVKKYGITCLMKLSTRLTDPGIIAKTKILIEKYRQNISIELQQRSVEYGQLFLLDKPTREGILERMPPLESALKDEANKSQRGTDKKEDLLGGLSMGGAATAAPVASNPSDVLAGLFGSPTVAAPKKENVMDLLGGLGLGGPVAFINTMSVDPLAGLGFGSLGMSSTAAAPVNNVLGDIFGGSSMASMTLSSTQRQSLTPAAPIYAPPVKTDPMADLLGAAGFTSSTPPMSAAPSMVTAPSSFPMTPSSNPLISSTPPSAPATYTAYSKNGLQITFNATKDIHPTENIVNSVTITYKNTGASSVDNLSFQVAVPKTMKLAMQPPSSTSVAANSSATQLMKIANPAKAALKLRLKISYVGASGPVDEIVDFAGFSEELWA